MKFPLDNQVARISLSSYKYEFVPTRIEFSKIIGFKEIFPRFVNLTMQNFCLSPITREVIPLDYRLFLEKREKLVLHSAVGREAGYTIWHVKQ